MIGTVDLSITTLGAGIMIIRSVPAIIIIVLVNVMKHILCYQLPLQFTTAMLARVSHRRVSLLKYLAPE